MCSLMVPLAVSVVQRTVGIFCYGVCVAVIFLGSLTAMQSGGLELDRLNLVLIEHHVCGQENFIRLL